MEAEDGIESVDSAVALAGTAGHKALENYYTSYSGALQICPDSAEFRNPIDIYTTNLDDMTASRAKWYAHVMDNIIEAHGGAVEIHAEVAMSVVLKNGFGEVLLTGHNDLTVICADGVTLISDWKFNFLEVAEAAHNIQLMGYTLLAIKDATVPFKVGGDIHTILIAGGNENPFTAAKYTPSDTVALEKHILSIVSRSVAADAKRCPSDEGCKYCLAKCSTRCPETLAEVSNGSPLALALCESHLPENIEAATKQVLVAKGLAKLCAAYVDRYNDFVRDNEDLCDGYAELQKPRVVREIVDCQAAHDAITAPPLNLLTSDEFLTQCVDVKIGKLEKALKPVLTARGEKVKDHKMVIAGLLGDALKAESDPDGKRVVKITYKKGGGGK
jgi:hypothetical protein